MISLHPIGPFKKHNFSTIGSWNRMIALREWLRAGWRLPPENSKFGWFSGFSFNPFTVAGEHENNVKKCLLVDCQYFFLGRLLILPQEGLRLITQWVILILYLHITGTVVQLYLFPKRTWYVWNRKANGLTLAQTHKCHIEPLCLMEIFFSWWPSLLFSVLTSAQPSECSWSMLSPPAVCSVSCPDLLAPSLSSGTLSILNLNPMSSFDSLVSSAASSSSERTGVRGMDSPLTSCNAEVRWEWWKLPPEWGGCPPRWPPPAWPSWWRWAVWWWWWRWAWGSSSSVSCDPALLWVILARAPAASKLEFLKMDLLQFINQYKYCQYYTVNFIFNTSSFQFSRLF